MLLLQVTELVASLKTFVSYYHTSYPERCKSWKLKHSVTDVHQHIPCYSWMDECDSVVPLNVDPFQPRVKWTNVSI